MGEGCSRVGGGDCAACFAVCGVVGEGVENFFFVETKQWVWARFSLCLSTAAVWSLYGTEVRVAGGGVAMVQVFCRRFEVALREACLCGFYAFAWNFEGIHHRN